MAMTSRDQWQLRKHFKLLQALQASSSFKLLQALALLQALEWVNGFLAKETRSMSSLSLEPGSSLMGGTQGRQRSRRCITFASRGRFPVRATMTVTGL